MVKTELIDGRKVDRVYGVAAGKYYRVPCFTKTVFHTEEPDEDDMWLDLDPEAKKLVVKHLFIPVINVPLGDPDERFYLSYGAFIGDQVHLPESYMLYDKGTITPSNEPGWSMKYILLRARYST
jgi:hypothetical protein